MAEVVCDLEQRRAERLERLVGVQAPLLLLGLPLELARQRCQMLVERVLLLGELAPLLTRLVALPRTGVGGDQSGHDARRGRDGGGLDGVSHAPPVARRHVPARPARTTSRQKGVQRERADHDERGGEQRHRGVQRKQVQARVHHAR